MSKQDIALLQWHVANGTALGYTFQNAVQGRQQIPKPPKITVVCKPGVKCSPKAIKAFQKIVNKLVEANWKILYSSTLTEVAKVRIPSSEVTQETDKNGGGLKAGTGGLEINTDVSKETTNERLKSLETKLKNNEDYLNNNAIAIQELEEAGSPNAAELVSGVNKILLDSAEKALAPADQSPSVPGSLPLRRADPNMTIRPAPLVSPSERIRRLIMEGHTTRSIWQD